MFIIYNSYPHHVLTIEYRILDDILKAQMTIFPYYPVKSNFEFLVSSPIIEANHNF